MASRGTPLPILILARLYRLRSAGWSLRRCARQLGVSKNTALKYSPSSRLRIAA